MQRACAAALLSGGRSLIRNPGQSNDDRAALDVIRALGARVTGTPGGLQIESGGVRPITTDIDCGESGLSIRMFTPLAALSGQQLTISGSGSLLNRPMDFFDTVLPAWGVEVQSNEGRLPLVVKGPLNPVSVEIDGSLSSQFLTGLLMACAAADARGVTIRVRDLKSKPYIDLTLDVMRRFGLKVPQNNNYTSFYFDNAPAPARGGTHEYTVEGDWSSAAFLLVAGAVAGYVTIAGLDRASAQADKAILDALTSAGAAMTISDNGIEVQPSDLRAFTFDATDCPDLFPPLVALAAWCRGESRIKGASRLAHKESDRALTLQEEFGKMGLEILLQDDMMIVLGGQGLRGATVRSRNDHRIAMAIAVAALQAGGTTTIEAAEAVRKSYPGFFTDLQQLGAAIFTQQ